MHVPRIAEDGLSSSSQGRAGRLSALAPLDRALLLILTPLWLLCCALFFETAARDGIAWPGVYVAASESINDYPVVAGFWTGSGGIWTATW
jgi:hypothetical protein